MFLFDEVYFAGGPKIFSSSVMHSAGHKKQDWNDKQSEMPRPTNRRELIGNRGFQNISRQDFFTNCRRQSLICDHYEGPVLWPVPAMSLLPTNQETAGRNRTQSSSDVRSRLVESSFATF